MTEFREALKSLTDDELRRLDNALAALQMFGGSAQAVDHILEQILHPQSDDELAAKWAAHIGVPFAPSAPREHVIRRRMTHVVEGSLTLSPPAGKLHVSGDPPNVERTTPRPSNVIDLSHFVSKCFGASPAPCWIGGE